MGGDNRATLVFYKTVPSGVSRVITVYNDTSSETDVNFAVYLLKPNGQLGSKLSGWFNDIHAGKSKKVRVGGSMDPQEMDIAVVIENDGWYFQDNVSVSGKVVFN